MRNKSSFVQALIVTTALVGSVFAAATPAAAQPDTTLGVQYNWFKLPGGSLDGFTVDMDRVIWGDYFTLAAGGTYVRGGNEILTASQFFAGVGPGIRWPIGNVEAFAHALFGYRRDSSALTLGPIRGSMAKRGFDARFAGGIDYPMGERYGIRLGAAYGGNLNLTAGLSIGF